MNDAVRNVAVVILNWNGKKFLEKFLPDVVKKSSIADIIVADNGSTDDSVIFLQQRFPSVQVLNLGENWGFAAGYNLALEQLDYKYYVLLNSDVEVTDNWIEPLKAFMDAHEEYGACQPKLLSYYEKNKFEYAGAAGGYIDFLGYPFCRGRIFQEVETDNHQYDEFYDIFWATGACMFVRGEAFKQLGGFDGNFFAHMEEIDLCWRMKNAGYKISYCPTSTVYHVGGGTLPRNSARKTYLNMRNNITMIYKNLPKGAVFPVLFVRFFLDIIAAFKFICDGNPRDFIAVGKAHLSFIRHFGLNRAKRKSINHHEVSCIYKKSIVFQHYIKKTTTFASLEPKDFS